MKKPFKFTDMEIENEVCDTYIIRSDNNKWFAIYFTMSDAEKAYNALNRADLFDELVEELRFCGGIAESYAHRERIKALLDEAREMK